MNTKVKERAIVKLNGNAVIFRPPAIVNLPIVMPEKTQEKGGQLETLPALAKGILQIRLPEPPPVVYKPEPIKLPKLPKPRIHPRREEVFD